MSSRSTTRAADNVGAKVPNNRLLLNNVLDIAGCAGRAGATGALLGAGAEVVRVRRWVEALDRFDATGDYAVFAPLLMEDGVAADKANCCKPPLTTSGSSTYRMPDGRFAPSCRFLMTAFPGPSACFNVSWPPGCSGLKHQERWQWRRALAFQYLDRRDFVRAAMLAWEAWVSRLCSEQGLPGGSGDETDLNAFNERKEVVEEFERELQTAGKAGEGHRADPTAR